MSRRLLLSTEANFSSKAMMGLLWEGVAHLAKGSGCYSWRLFLLKSTCKVVRSWSLWARTNSRVTLTLLLINETVSRPTFYQKDTEPHTVYCCTFAITEAVLSTLPGTDGVKPFNGHIKTAVQRPLFSNTVISTLAVDGWAVTFGTARRGLGGLRPRPVPSSLYQM